MKLQNRRGVVLVSTMLFLMIVTLMALSSIQTPMTDIHITNNFRLESNAQLVANISVKEAKNWLLYHHNNSVAPKNNTASGQGYIGPLPKLNTTGDEYGFTDAAKVLANFGSYRWRIVHLSEGVSLPDYETTDTTDPKIGIAIKNRLLDIPDTEFRNRKQLFEGQSAALDQSSAYEEYYYIYGRGTALLKTTATNIYAESEAIVSYKQVLPNLN